MLIFEQRECQNVSDDDGLRCHLKRERERETSQCGKCVMCFSVCVCTYEPAKAVAAVSEPSVSEVEHGAETSNAKQKGTEKGAVKEEGQPIAFGACVGVSTRRNRVVVPGRGAPPPPEWAQLDQAVEPRRQLFSQLRRDRE